jgi:uncharacterized membrane protein
MNIKTEKYRLAITIITCHLVLLGLVVLLLIVDALLMEEFTPLLTLLAPVTAVYSGTVFRYISNLIRSNEGIDRAVPNESTQLAKQLVIGHFSAMLFLLSAKFIFNWIEYTTMTVLMTLLETSFGVYMGMVVNAIFESKNS